MTKKSPKNAVAAAPNASTGGKIGKAQLVETVAEMTGLSKKQSDAAVEPMLESVIGGLRAGQNVTLLGLGTLSVKATAARTGVKPGTSEKIQIPAGKKVSYKVASTLKGSVNG
ncbi:HU family DNA-binding protein [Deinococcus hopiensis]|uniref:DNA-binding protein HU-beta n=1 Tax=Deinococcus hopiensis KR-140 TaxID=695939 RepID=A0A1W1UYK4_9DEIO|nr:HU family DNA-binding protein [Deinococcus hopiensis]SMB86168.1 DNA-binding protein HU-beta [Deinococcus hopiensis KR-140]